MSFIFIKMLVLYQTVSISGFISNIYWHASNWSSISFSHWQCPSDSEFSFPRFLGLIILSLWFIHQDELSKNIYRKGYYLFYVKVKKAELSLCQSNLHFMYIAESQLWTFLNNLTCGCCTHISTWNSNECPYETRVLFCELGIYRRWVTTHTLI
jgi:hypothetical protein